MHLTEIVNDKKTRSHSLCHALLSSTTLTLASLLRHASLQALGTSFAVKLPELRPALTSSSQSAWRAIVCMLDM